MKIYLPVFVSTHDVVRAHWQAVGLDLKNENKIKITMEIKISKKHDKKCWNVTLTSKYF